MAFLKLAGKMSGAPILLPLRHVINLGTLAAILGIQFVGIPEFAALGTNVSQGVSSAIAGQGSVADALAKGQEAAQKVGDKYKQP